MKTRILVIAVVIMLLLAGMASAHTVRMTPMHMSHLDQGNYQAWIVNSSGVPMSVTSFNVRETDQTMWDMNGNRITSISTPFPVNNGDMMLVTADNQGTNMPASMVVLQGKVRNSTAMLNMGADFSTAAGKYILATPTNGPNTNELSGIWFLKRGTDMTTAASGLWLPGLPSGWQYEGWVMVSNRPLSTGKFNHAYTGYVVGADMSAQYSGTMAGPPFPGEDFLRNAPAGMTFPLNLQGQMTAITVEPNPDNDPGPSDFMVLSATIPSNAMDHEEYVMTNRGNMAPMMRTTITP